MLPYAPGARVVVRDEEWLVRRVDSSSDGGYLASIRIVSPWSASGSLAAIGVVPRNAGSQAGRAARGTLKQAGCVPRQSILGAASGAGPSAACDASRPAGLPSRTELPRTKEPSGIGRAVCSIPACSAARLARRAAAGSGSGTLSRRMGLCAGEKSVPACGAADAGCAQAAAMRTPATASSCGRPLQGSRSSVAPDTAVTRGPAGNEAASSGCWPGASSAVG